MSILILGRDNFFKHWIFLKPFSHWHYFWLRYLMSFRANSAQTQLNFIGAERILSRYFYFALGLKVNSRSCKRSNNSFGEKKEWDWFLSKTCSEFSVFLPINTFSNQYRQPTQKLMFFILGRCNFSETILRSPISNLEYHHKVSLFLCNKTPVKPEQNKQFSFSD